MKAYILPLLLVAGTLLLTVSCDDNNSKNNNPNDPNALPDVSNLPDKPTSNAPTDPIEINLEAKMPTGNVHDYEDVFTKEEELKLDSLLQELKKNTSIDMVIMSIDGSYTNATDFDFYTQQTMNAMGLGDPDKGNAVMFAFSTDLRKLRINKDPGVTKFWPDAESQTMINNYLLPGFGRQEYFETTKAFLEVLAEMGQQRAPKEWRNNK